MMEQITLVLILAAVLLAFVLLFIRTARFEAYLKEIRGVRSLDDRIRNLSEILQRLDTRPLEQHLAEIHRECARIFELLDRRSQTVRVDPQVEVRSLLESVLYGMGFQRVRLLGDPREIQGPGPVEVPVECVKSDVIHKGTVTVQNGSVVECRIRPAYEVFP